MVIRQTIRLLIFTLLSMTIIFSACQAKPDELQKIKLAVGYIPNVQFAPFYVAIEKGYFAEEGLEVELTYGYEIDGVSLVGANEYQFAVASGEQVILARDKELPVVYVMNWYDKFPVGITALKESGIENLADLRGRSVGTPALQGASYIAMEALLDFAGIKDSDLSIQVIGFTQAEMLSSQKVDAVVVYLANEPVLLRSQGYEIVSFPVSDYVDLVGNGIVTNEKTIKNDPELVRRMIRATLRGIQFAAENPEQAYTISTKYVENMDKSDNKIQFDVLRKSIEFWSLENPGKSDLQAWNNTEELLRTLGMITNNLEVTDMFTNQYLP